MVKLKCRHPAKQKVGCGRTSARNGAELGSGHVGSKDAHLFGIQVTERIQKVTGLRITLHQYRHAAAAVYLKHHPGDYETVRRFLGHRNIRTTVKFYCGLETIQATRMLGDVVRQHRLTDPDETGDRP